ncbi:MAG: hypothetical protein V3U70_02795, partial [Thermoplasmata archaeon]
MRREAFSNLWIWDKVGDRLPWYCQVANNKMPAKYLIAQRIPCQAEFNERSLEELWSEHEHATEGFLELWDEIRSGRTDLRDLNPVESSLVDLSAELAHRMLKSCIFCRWRCRIDRSVGTKHGTCQLESESRMSSYFHHRGEELVFRGTQGSGTIFFTSCNLRCVFCISGSSFVMTDGGPRQISDLYDAAGFETEYEGGHVRFPEELVVQSGEGQPVRVTKIFRHPFKGKLLRIKPLYAPPITVTPDHQMLAAEGKDGRLVKIPAGELSPKHYLAIPRFQTQQRDQMSLDVVSIIRPHAEAAVFRTPVRLPDIMQALAMSQTGATSREIGDRTGFNPTYVRALLGKIRRKGIPEGHRPNGVILEEGTVRLKTEKRPGIPATIPISPRLAEFLGYYCAEGYTTRASNRPSSYTVALTFGRHEIALVRRTSKLIRELFRLEPKIVRRRTAISVELGKTSLGLLLGDLCGSNAHAKRVPEFLFHASPEVVESFLQAHAAGDGCVTGGYLSLNTVSRRLAMGLFALYLRQGHLPTFNVYDPPRRKEIEGRRVRQSRLYYVKVHTKLMREGNWETAKWVRYKFRDRHVLVPVHRISRRAHTGFVFNLEVDDDTHTYAANFVGVGNCQNGNISQDKDNGIPVTPEQLAAAAWQLRMEGCHNINWVGGDPTIHLHTIVKAIALLAKNQVNLEDLDYVSAVKADFGRSPISGEKGRYNGEINVPMLWNSNFFMSPETMRILRPLIDVWLPDFKFGNDKCSVFLARTPWYWETVSRNHQLVYDWGEDMVIRHLVMPGHVDCCTKPVLNWIAAHTPEALVNVMDQYHPDYACNPGDPNY